MTSVTDPNTMWDEFRTNRTATLAQLPLPLDPASIVRYDGGSTPTDPGTSPAITSSTGATQAPDTLGANLSGAASTGATPSGSSDLNSWANKYGKVVLALLGANLVFGVGLFVVALAVWVRGRKGRIVLGDSALRSAPAVLKIPVEA